MYVFCNKNFTMTMKFKQWLDLQEQLDAETDQERLDEIFGKFFGKSKQDEKKRELAKKKFEANKKKRELEKLEIEAKNARDQKVVAGVKTTPSRTTSKAAQDKAAEREWLDGLV